MGSGAENLSMDLLFVGQNILGGVTLQHLLESDIVPTLVVTRQHNDYPNSVADLCRRHGLLVHMTAQINDDPWVHRFVHRRNIDIAFCCSWGHRIRNRLRSVPRLGWVNFHPSYLPAYRGPSPIEWQIINGETSGGCTAHYMTPQFDDGPILLQQRVPITSNDNRETMQLKCGLVMGQIAVACYRLLSINPCFRGSAQDDTNASYAPPRDLARRIRLDMPARDICNLVRALAPYPCATLTLGNRELEIMEAVETDIGSEPNFAGRCYWTDHGKLVVAAVDRLVVIQKIRLHGAVLDDYVDV